MRGGAGRGVRGAQGDRSIIKVHFLDNGYKGLQVTAAMTVDDVLKSVAEKLDLKDTEHFCLYEVNKDVGTRSVDVS